MAEIMSVLFLDVMRYHVHDPQNPNNDRFVFSKGHAAPILYAVWVEPEDHPTPINPDIKIKADIKSSQDRTGIDVIKAISFSSNIDWLCTALGSPIKIWDDKDSPMCSWAPQEERLLDSAAEGP